jgi:general secretion pathway protein F
MPAYSFDALTAQGETRKGILEADTARTARSLLRAQDLVPLRVEAVGAGAKSDTAAPRSIWQMTLWQSRVFSATALAIWTRQLPCAGARLDGLV